MNPLVLFFGLVVIREFCYRFKFSIAYYELLTIDAPYTDYDDEVRNDNVLKVDKKSIDKNKEALERMRKRRQSKERK